MDKPDLAAGIFMIIFVCIFLGAILYEEHTKAECTKFALEKNISIAETKSLCRIAQ